MAEFIKEAWTFIQQNMWLPACYAAAGIAITVAAAPGIVIGPALHALGFAASGIVKGSLAAAWQSSIGSVVAASFFATLQSAGALGAGASVVGGAVAAAAAIVGGIIAAACLKLCWPGGNDMGAVSQ